MLQCCYVRVVEGRHWGSSNEDDDDDDEDVNKQEWTTRRMPED